MNSKMKQFEMACLLAGLLIVGLIALNGCKESEPSGSEASGEKKQETGEQKWTCPMHPQIITDRPSKCPTCGMDLVPVEAEQKRGAMTMPMPAKELASVVEQTACPIMGGAIDKAIFTEYQGKKVYFCCPGCEDKFQEVPEKYIAKLPQFKD